MSPIPHLRVVVGTCIIAVIGYATLSGWAVFWSDDAALRGDVIGTWKSFAVMAFGFWIGSSSGGKATAGPPAPQDAKEAADQTAGAATHEAERIGAQAT